MARRIADILAGTRKQYFVGREKELLNFKKLISSTEFPYFLLYLYGMGGQGKTSLVKEMIELCKQYGFVHLYLDARDINANPHSFKEILYQILGLETNQDLFEFFEHNPNKVIIFIDTYEKFSPIDDWLRQDFLPLLPDNVLTVISGRIAPSARWLADSAWQQLMKTVELRNLSPIESKEYLEKRQIPIALHTKMMDFTHGHPLALSVVADTYNQSPQKDFRPEESPDIIRTLLEHFVQKTPSPAHRATLEICGLVHITTESLISKVLDFEDVSELFEWLQSLSFVESNKFGVYPHDLAREALCADLRWRNPDWHTELHKRIRLYYKDRFEKSTGEAQFRALFGLNYLHRNHPLVRPYFDWQETGTYWLDFAKNGDMPFLRMMTAKNEGENVVKILDFWANRREAQIWVLRDIEKIPKGYVLKINLNEINPEEKIPDTAVQKVIRHASKNLHLRKGEICTLFRSWMAEDTYQAVSNLQSSIFLSIVQYYLTTPSLAITMLACTYPEFWKSVLNYADLEWLQELDFQVENQDKKMNIGWYLHDWRKTPPAAWLVLLGQRELDTSEQVSVQEKPQLQLMVLSEEEFLDSIYNALKDFYNYNRLVENPLARSKFVVNALEPDAPEDERVSKLKEKLQLAIKKIETSPRDEKFYRVLYRTFINVAGSQEQTADFLNIPFSTYRRYLKKGIQLVTEILWNEEVER
jgi:hypothetical protein